MTFVPHLVPITRGIVTTAYGRMRGERSTAELLDAFRDFYADEPFVRLREDAPPEAKHVAGTNFIDCGVQADPGGGLAIAMSAVDNLGKGLPTAALQCLNVMYGYEETLGLGAPALWP